MNVVALRTLREFWERHREAERPLRDWHNLLRRERPANFARLKATFPSVDLVRSSSGNPLVVFDVHGNRYRVVARLDYDANLALIRHVMTHAEYDRWNKQGRPE